MRRIQIWLFVIMIIMVSACSTLQLPVIEVKNNVVLQDGFSLGTTSFRHDFVIYLKSSKALKITNIDYSLKIPNYQQLNGTFKIEKNISLNPEWEYIEVKLRSEETSYLNFCEQMNAMFRSKNADFSMKMNLIFETENGKKMNFKDLEVRIKNSGFWDKLRNIVVEKGCGVLAIPAITELLFKFFGN